MIELLGSVSTNEEYGGSGFLGLGWSQHVAELPLKGISAHGGCNTLNQGQLGRSFYLGEHLVQSLWPGLMFLGQSMKLGFTFYTPGFSRSLTILAMTHSNNLSLIGVSEGVVVQEERS